MNNKDDYYLSFFNFLLFVVDFYFFLAGLLLVDMFWCFDSPSQVLSLSHLRFWYKFILA